MIEKMYDHDIERGVLGLLLNEFRLYNKIEGRLAPTDFHEEKNELIFDTMSSLFLATGTFDLLTIINTLKKNGVFEKVEQGYLLELTHSYNLQAFDNYVEIISQLSQRRQIQRMCTKVAMMTLDGSKKNAFIIQETYKTMETISNKSAKSSIRTRKEIANTVTKRIKDLQDGNIHLTKLFGIPALDNYLAVEEDELIVIGARSNMGKSMLANTICANIGQEQNVLYFSMEMSDTRCAHRLMSYYSCINSIDFKKGNVDILSTEYEAAFDGFTKSKINICDQVNLSAQDVVNECTRLKTKNGLDVVIVDHGILLDVDLNGKNHAEALGDISKTLQQMARSLKVIVILLWQLSNAAEHSNNGRPSRGHLRSSGRILEDADRVLLIWRPDQYGLLQHEGIDTKGKAFIIIAKNRDGETNIEIPLKFEPEKARFSGLGLCQKPSHN